VGRTLDARDDGPTAAPAMMLTDAYWRRAFGGDPAVFGRVLRVNGRSAEVVGVAEPAPSFPVENDVFVNMVVSPHHLDPTMVTGRTHRMTSVFGRLAPGPTPRQAQVELDAVMARLHREYPDAYDPGAGYKVTATPRRDALTERARKSVLLRLNALLVAAFGAVALAIAAVGIGGTLAFFIARRTAEIGIRMSLGADSRRVMGMVLGDGGRLLLLGLGLGLVGSAVLARGIRGMLFGVPAADPVTFVGVAVVVLVVGLAACAGPALRAARVDPLMAMRAE
jgi:hypothetical protein